MRVGIHHCVETPLTLRPFCFCLVHFLLLSLSGVLGEWKAAALEVGVDLGAVVEGQDVVVGEVEVGVVEEEVATSLLLPLKTNWMLISMHTNW